MRDDIHYQIEVKTADGVHKSHRKTCRELSHFGSRLRAELYYKELGDDLNMFLEALTHELADGDTISSLKHTILAAKAVQRGFDICTLDEDVKRSEVFASLFADGEPSYDFSRAMTLVVSGPFRKSTSVARAGDTSSEEGTGTCVDSVKVKTDPVRHPTTSGILGGLALGATGIAFAAGTVLGSPILATGSALILAGTGVSVGVHHFRKRTRPAVPPPDDCEGTDYLHPDASPCLHSPILTQTETDGEKAERKTCSRAGRILISEIPVDDDVTGASIVANAPLAPTVPLIAEPHHQHNHRRLHDELELYRTRYEREAALREEVQQTYEAKLGGARALEKQLLERVLSLEKRLKRFTYISEHPSPSGNPPTLDSSSTSTLPMTYKPPSS